MRAFQILIAVLTGLSSAVFGGPDLVCSSINDAVAFGTSDEGIHSYSFGTTVCNIGDEAVGWVPDTNEHPLISQTLYKLKDHQITQIGIGFVRHTTIPSQGNACGLGCSPAPGIEMLGPGCSDTSSGIINGSQALMGPRTEVNAQSGSYPYPFTSISLTGDATYKRLQVPASEISDSDALYFVETQVISSYETTPESRENNMSYRQVIFSPGSLSPILTGPTYAQQPAIFAWRDHGYGIGVPDPEVMITAGSFIDIRGLVLVGSKAINLGGKLYDHWEYRYVVLNMNGRHGVGKLGVSNLFCSSPDAVVVSTQFVAPTYHDDLDDQVVNTPWTVSVDENRDWLEWSTGAYEQNPDANAIRWGTMYSFSFEVMDHFGPSYEGVGIQPFEKNAGINWYWLAAWAPAHCDFVCMQDMNHDGELDFVDIALFAIEYTNQSPAADVNGDTEFDFVDISFFVTGFIAGCP